MIACGFICLSGCRFGQPRASNTLEFEVRDKSRTIASLKEEAAMTRAELQSARREAKELRRVLDDRQNVVAPSESFLESARVDRLEISSLLTGGLDRDDAPGDELLTVLVQTVNKAGETIQATGSLILEAHDFSRDAGDRRIGVWDWASSETLELWQSGIVGKGYRVIVPWQTAPKNSEIVLFARFDTEDGREFEATHTVLIKVGSVDSTRVSSGGVVSADEIEELDVRRSPSTIVDSSEE